MTFLVRTFHNRTFLVRKFLIRTFPHRTFLVRTFLNRTFLVWSDLVMTLLMAPFNHSQSQLCNKMEQWWWRYHVWQRSRVFEFASLRSNLWMEVFCTMPQRTVRAPTTTSTTESTATRFRAKLTTEATLPESHRWARSAFDKYLKRKHNPNLSRNWIGFFSETRNII